MIHQYKLNGYNIVLDVYSGSVHLVDPVAYDIIALYETTPPDEIVNRILEKYGHLPDVDEGELRDCLEDIASYREIEDDGRHVVLCHYPIPSFHDHYLGWFHLYGHVHTSFEWNVNENARRLLKNLYLRGDVCRMANAGAMLPYMAYTPRSLDELLPQF